MKLRNTLLILYKLEKTET